MLSAGTSFCKSTRALTSENFIFFFLSFFDLRYDEWAHPYFISIEEYERLCGKTGKLTSISGANWVKVILI